MRHARYFALSLILLLVSTGSARSAPSTTASEYTKKTVRGWTVLVNKQLLAADPQLAAECLALLDTKLYDVTRVVPAKALEKIRAVTLWLENDDPKFPGGVYHPSREWLAQNGVNPDKAKGVEFGNASHLLSWSLDQPNLVLHELAHAYHDQVLGYDNPEIAGAYQAAKESKKYEGVLRISGQVEKAYAMNNDQEYFAELSEAYFGTNDYYPFVRAEVQKADPKMYEVLRKVWNL
jgi:hypothetical protein